MKEPPTAREPQPGLVPEDPGPAEQHGSSRAFAHQLQGVFRSAGSLRRGVAQTPKLVLEALGMG